MHCSSVTSRGVAELVLSRHGETEWCACGRAAGCANREVSGSTRTHYDRTADASDRTCDRVRGGNRLIARCLERSAESSRSIS